MERLHQSRCRFALQPVVRCPHPSECGNYRKVAAHRWADRLGHGIRYHWKALSENYRERCELNEVGPYRLPVPCICLFPATIAAPRNNPSPKARALASAGLLSAFDACFRGEPDEINFVDFDVEKRGAKTLRITRIRRGGNVSQESAPTAIRRT